MQLQLFETVDSHLRRVMLGSASQLHQHRDYLRTWIDQIDTTLNTDVPPALRDVSMKQFEQREIPDWQRRVGLQFLESLRPLVAELALAPLSNHWSGRLRAMRSIDYFKAVQNLIVRGYNPSTGAATGGFAAVGVVSRTVAASQ